MMRFALLTAAVLVAAGSAPAQNRLRLFGSNRPCPPTPYAPADCPPLPALSGTSGTPLAPALPGQQQPGQPGELPPMTDPAAAAQPPSSSAFSQALASAGESGTQAGASYMPGFFGDLIASCIGQEVFVPEQGMTRVICSPNVSQMGSIKLAEGDSPRPQDRIYYQYNYFGGVEVNIPDPAAPLMSVHRHVLGFEKTLLGGDASVGLRLPFFNLGGDSEAYQTSFVGDLTIITKYALRNNPETGNVLSTGLVITTPTGGSPDLMINAMGEREEQRRYRPVLLQPFIGYIWNPTNRLFFQGYHSVAVPTDSNDPTFMSNGLGLGYWLYRNPGDSIIQGIIPTFEVHVNTPFNHREAHNLGETLMGDSVNLTMGTYVVMPRSSFGGAVGVPLAFGPHQIEAVARYTLRY